MIRFGSGKTLKILDQMLNDAIDGTFEESRFDETELSRLESKWKKFLSSARLSMEQTKKERAGIQALVADISHQTKTPLANILLYSELLLEQVQSEEERRLAEQIYSQTEKLEFLIQSLVKMSRLESNVLAVMPVTLPIRDLVVSSLEAISQKAGKKRIELVFQSSEEFPDDKIKGWYDAKWTEEALVNILDNAVKYSPEKSKIIVSVREYEFYVCISVRDQGMGIPESERAQIFERFYRSGQVQQAEGIGIGLYLVREILQREEGYIKVSSTPGEGSDFGIYLRKLEKI